MKESLHQLIGDIRVWIEDLPVWLTVMIREILPVFVIVLGLAIEIKHIDTSRWINIFLYNSDSLLLPAVRSSISHHEVFQWVFSSQLYLFPEGLFYAICSIFSSGVAFSQVLNAYLNVIVLYILIRLVVGQVVKSSLFKYLSSIILVLFFIAIMILERQPDVNQTSIATLFIFNTYYYGVTLAGIGSLYVSLLLIRRGITRISQTRLTTLLIIGFLLASLSTFSDPLYLIQFALPFFIAIMIMFIVRVLSLKNSLLLVSPQLFGIIFGYLVRKPFHRLIGRNTGQYISIANIGQSIHIMHATVAEYLHTPSGFIELLLILSSILLVDIYSLYLIYCQIIKKEKVSHAVLLIELFSGLSPWLLVAIILITGTTTTRYFLPVIVFPILGLSVILYRLYTNFRKIFSSIAYIIIASTIIAGALSFPYTIYLTKQNNKNYSGCLERALDYRPANGVAEYWDSRPLNLYGLNNEQVLQVSNDFKIFSWLNNLGSYPNKVFTFVIVDKQATSPLSITRSNLLVLGKPQQIHVCSNFYVYIYPKNSFGSNKITNQVMSSYNALTKM